MVKLARKFVGGILLFVGFIFLILGCAIANASDLPDPLLTPGVTRALTLEQVCNTKWGKDARAVTEAMKRQVYKSYGMGPYKGACALSPRGCEVDHLISRELGGADDVKNLWPQPYGGEWSAVKKDQLENRLHKLVCAGTLTLDTAQQAISSNWIEAYQHYLGAGK
jgi:hypothetical protein